MGPQSFVSLVCPRGGRTLQKEKALAEAAGGEARGEDTHDQ